MESAGFNVRILPLYTDNRCYYIFSTSDPKHGVFVDVGEPKVVEYCKSAGIVPSAVLSTHKHNDHTGGNLAMKE